MNTIGISPEVQYNNSITVEDITKESSIDSTKLKVLTYSHPHDTCDGIEIHLGNQAMKYPFTCLGHNWKAVEYLYLCGEWSWEGEDAKAIQEDVLTARSGYAAAAYYHGANGMGKILTICRRCLKEGTSPKIDTALLNSKGIYNHGEKVQF